MVRDVPKLINDPRMTINAIKQQMIMRDIAFEQDTRTKKDLEMIVASVEPTKWKNEVPEPVIIKRLKKWKDEHGSLPIPIPIENVNAKPSFAETANQAKTGLPASSSNAQANTSISDDESDKDIPQYQKAPILAPLKVGIQGLRDTLIPAFNDKRITDKKDIEIYQQYIEVLGDRKASKSERTKARKELTKLYAKYVYNPKKEKSKRHKEKQPVSPKNVKKGNVKEKNKSK